MNSSCLKFLIGFLIGFLVFQLSTNGTGKKPKIFYIIQIYIKKDRCLHIHHWLLCMIILLFLLVFNCYREYTIIGFLSGAIVQGLTFPDRFKLNEKCLEQ